MDGRNLVFIAGCPRSGTTYLQRLLAALPSTLSGQESHLFYFVGMLWNSWKNFEKDKEIDPRGGVGLPCYFSSEEFQAILHDFTEKLLQPMVTSLREGDIFVEKTPSNALHIEVIHKLLPRAKIIFIQRDARDVVASLLAASRTWGKHWAPSNAKDAALLWRRYTLLAERALNHVPASLYFKIKYEGLLENPVKWLTEISSFLSVNCSEEEIVNAVRENSLESARKGGGTKLASGSQANNNSKGYVIEPEGFIRKGMRNSWKSDLTAYEKICVWRIARHEMKKAGYEWKFPW